MKALWADTAFLAGQGVMDYSLLVGVDSPNGALVVGIIDFLRQVRATLQTCAASVPAYMGPGLSDPVIFTPETLPAAYSVQPA